MSLGSRLTRFTRPRPDSLRARRPTECAGEWGPLTTKTHLTPALFFTSRRVPCSVFCRISSLASPIPASASLQLHALTCGGFSCESSSFAYQVSSGLQSAGQSALLTASRYVHCSCPALPDLFPLSGPTCPQASTTDSATSTAALHSTTHLHHHQWSIDTIPTH